VERKGHSVVQQNIARANAQAQERSRAEKEQKENRRFWATVILSGVAALAAVAGVVLQLIAML